MNHNGYCYIEKITLYLSPDGLITLVMGNQRLTVNAEQVERIVEDRLRRHAVFVEVVGGHDRLQVVASE